MLWNLRPLSLAFALLASLSLAIPIAAHSKQSERPVVRAIYDPVNTLHPFKFTGASAYRVMLYMVEFMTIEVGIGREFRPMLATHWEISKDKRTFTFHLRKGVKWHDGKALTAEDVKFSFEAHRDPKYDNAAWSAILDGVESATVIDSHTIQFRAKEPKFSIWRAVADNMRILPKHFYENVPKERWETEYIGTGPYILNSFEKGRRVFFRRNPEWWGRSVAKYKDMHQFPAVGVRFVNETVAAFSLIQSGDLDIFALNSKKDIESAKLQPGYGKTLKVVNDPSAEYTYLYEIQLNLDTPVFHSRQARLALNMLWDRDVVNQKIFAGKLTKMRSSWSSEAPFYEPRDNFVYDPKEASRLLQKEGWSDSNKDGALDRMRDGKREDFAFTIRFSQRELEPMLTMYQEAAKKIGVTVSLQYTDPNLEWKMVKERRYEAFASRFPSAGHILSSVFGTTGRYNSVAYSNPKVDRLLQEIDSEFDFKKRLALHKRVSRIIDADVISIRGFEEKNTFFAVGPRIEVPADPKKTNFRYWKLRE